MESILKNKYYLYLTEFFAGMSVMAVELGASRLLAPYFSSSQIVWTIIIGTIMIAMALGNIWGGRSADKNPNPDKLYMRLIVAALWIAAIPVVGKYIILGISAVLIVSINNNFLILAGFAACMVIFVFPLFLLGTVTPSLARYTVDSLDDSGKTVGTLGAFNTIGSIIGTFLPTFVTIPAVGTAVTFLIFSGILLLLGLVYFISKKARKGVCAMAVLVFILCGIFGHSGSFAFWENSLLYEGESIYNYLQVKETDDSVILSTNVLFGVQSIMKKGDSLTGMYYDYALAAPVMAGVNQKENADILVLGMGTGTYAKQCMDYFGNTSVERPRNVPRMPSPVSVPDIPELKKFIPTLSRRSSLIYSSKSQDCEMPLFVLRLLMRKRYLLNAVLSSSFSKAGIKEVGRPVRQPRPKGA